MKYLAAAALAAACLAGSAQAAEDDRVTYRVEAHGGWDRVVVGGGKDNGVTYGVGVGIDVPLGALAFIGFQGNADLSTTKECIGNLIVIGDRFCEKAGRDLSLVARAGFNVGNGIKIYALGGYAKARIKDSYVSNSALVPSFSSTANGDGWRAGAGTEVKLGGDVYTKLEYRYSNYEGGYERHQVIAGLGLGL
jgi:outer membrane immunogenic protein